MVLPYRNHISLSIICFEFRFQSDQAGFVDCVPAMNPAA